MRLDVLYECADVVALCLHCDMWDARVIVTDWLTRIAGPYIWH